MMAPTYLTQFRRQLRAVGLLDAQLQPANVVLLRQNYLVSHDEMLSLHTTPFVLVTPTSETAMIIPVGVLWMPDGWTDHPYSGPSQNPHLRLGDPQDPGGSADVADWNLDGDPLYLAITSFSTPLLNATLFLSAESAITGGDPANALALSLLYTIIDL
jgi:hypothetical protein